MGQICIHDATRGYIFEIDHSERLRGFPVMSYENALDILSRDDRFKATVYAMNTLLIHKGIYTQQEFQQLFVEWAIKEESKYRPPTVEKTTEVSA